MYKRTVTVCNSEGVDEKIQLIFGCIDWIQY